MTMMIVMTVINSFGILVFPSRRTRAALPKSSTYFIFFQADTSAFLFSAALAALSAASSASQRIIVE